MMTSAWAQTVQVEARVTGERDCFDSLPSSSMLTPRMLAMTSRNRPRAGSAFIVGHKLADISVLVDSHGFTVLAADINHGLGPVGRSQRAPLP